MSEEFVLERRDVRIAGGGGHSGRSKARSSRSMALSSSHFTFTHAPTGVMVSGRVIPGNYSRKELNRLNEKLSRALYERLEYEVSKKLRASGRKAFKQSDDIDSKPFEIIVGEFSVARLMDRRK